MIEIALTTVIAVLGFLQFRTIRSQRSLSELQFAKEVRNDWHSLQDHWFATLLLGGHYYHRPSQETKNLLSVFSDADELDSYVRVVHFNKRATWRELESQLDEDSLDLIRTHRLNQEVFRPPLTMLASLCDSILRGLVDVSTVYGVLGSHITRNSGSVRFITDVQPSTTYYLDDHPGVRRRLLILLDLMWAEAVRRGDLKPHEEERARGVKQERQTGRRNRRRLRIETRRAAGPMRAARLDWRLTAAQVDMSQVLPVRSLKRTWAWLWGFWFYKGDLYPSRSQWASM